MKKTIKRPDGTEEVVEGTAEEIAEYERKLREGTKPSKKKPVLHGAEVDGIPLTEDESMLVRMKRAGFLEKSAPVFVPYIQPYVQPSYYYCQVCGVYNCMQAHIWYGTTTGSSIKLGASTYIDGTTLNVNADSSNELQVVVGQALESFSLIGKGWTPPVS